MQKHDGAESQEDVGHGSLLEQLPLPQWADKDPTKTSTPSEPLTEVLILDLRIKRIGKPPTHEYIRMRASAPAAFTPDVCSAICNEFIDLFDYVVATRRLDLGNVDVSDALEYLFIG